MDMAEVLVSRLREEHETLANHVGTRVKDEAIGELRRLREEVVDLREQNTSAMQEIAKLKLDAIREKEQIKRDFEKEKLKRVKDMEEKTERIEELERETLALKDQVKDKLRLCKMAEKKAKLADERRAKAEEGYKSRVQEMKKELNRAKGDLLMFRSKRRVQSSSVEDERAQRQKTHLISRFGQSAGNRPRIPPPDVPLVEGD